MAGTVERKFPQVLEFADDLNYTMDAARGTCEEELFKVETDLGFSWSSSPVAFEGVIPIVKQRMACEHCVLWPLPR